MDEVILVTLQPGTQHPCNALCVLTFFPPSQPAITFYNLHQTKFVGSDQTPLLVRINTLLGAFLGDVLTQLSNHPNLSLVKVTQRLIAYSFYCFPSWI